MPSWSSIAAETEDLAVEMRTSVLAFGFSLEHEVDTLAERVVDPGDGETPGGPCTQLAVEHGIHCPDDCTSTTRLHTLEQLHVDA
jgi:hypothetical protein